MLEIERKFLVDAEKWNSYAKGDGVAIQQGYIFHTDNGVLRVRTKGEKGFLTVKSSTVGMTRQEYEYEIPLAEAVELLNNFCTKYISKTRYKVTFGTHTWEIDEFHQQLAPLILAEIELSNEEETFAIPTFITEEVTYDPRYYNSNLITNY